MPKTFWLCSGMALIHTEYEFDSSFFPLNSSKSFERIVKAVTSKETKFHFISDTIQPLRLECFMQCIFCNRNVNSWFISHETQRSSKIFRLNRLFTTNHWMYNFWFSEPLIISLKLTSTSITLIFNDVSWAWKMLHEFLNGNEWNACGIKTRREKKWVSTKYDSIQFFLCQNSTNFISAQNG